MSKTFRPGLRAWLGEVVGPAVIMAVLALAAFKLGSLGRGVVLAGGGCLALLALTFVLVRTWVRVDDQALSFRWGRHIHLVSWAEILAAAMVQDAQRRWMLLLGTVTGECRVPMHHLDRDAIWRMVQECVPPAALAADAFERLPAHKRWIAQREQLLAETSYPLRVAALSPLLKGTLAFGMLFPLWLLFLVLRQVHDLTGALVMTPVCLGPVAACALMLVLSGSVELDAAAVTRRTLWGRYAIRWEEVRWLEQDREGYSLVLHSEGKQLALNGPALWSGKDKARLLEVFNAQIQQRGLEVRPSRWALLKVSRNVRVRREEPREPPRP